MERYQFFFLPPHPLPHVCVCSESFKLYCNKMGSTAVWGGQPEVLFFFFLCVCVCAFPLTLSLVLFNYFIHLSPSILTFALLLQSFRLCLFCSFILDLNMIFFFKKIFLLFWLSFCFFIFFFFFCCSFFPIQLQALSHLLRRCIKVIQATGPVIQVGEEFQHEAEPLLLS